MAAAPVLVLLMEAVFHPVPALTEPTPGLFQIEEIIFLDVAVLYPYARVVKALELHDLVGIDHPLPVAWPQLIITFAVLAGFPWL